MKQWLKTEAIAAVTEIRKEINGKLLQNYKNRKKKKVNNKEGRMLLVVLERMVAGKKNYGSRYKEKIKKLKESEGNWITVLGFDHKTTGVERKKVKEYVWREDEGNRRKIVYRIKNMNKNRYGLMKAM